MKPLINYFADFVLYSICVICMMGGAQYLLDTKLNIDFWSVLLITAPLTFIIRDIRTQPLVVLNLGESNNDDHDSKSN